MGYLLRKGRLSGPCCWIEHRTTLGAAPRVCSFILREDDIHLLHCLSRIREFLDKKQFYRYKLCFERVVLWEFYFWNDIYDLALSDFLCHRFIILRKEVMEINDLSTCISQLSLFCAGTTVCMLLLRRFCEFCHFCWLWWLLLLFYFIFLETGSCRVAQDGLELLIYLPKPSELWDHRHAQQAQISYGVLYNEGNFQCSF